ncbi:hypothetical protein [Paraburkholderia caribensis]|uniref:hypothetical protein n=1 Tax=Paraburkholderia caribensis TaxID=75105 RepID=UPI0031D7BFF9
MSNRRSSRHASYAAANCNAGGRDESSRIDDILERADLDATVLFLGLYADACDPELVDDVFLDQRHWLRFGAATPAHARYFRPEIAEDAAENEGMAAARERVVVFGTCIGQLRKYGF